jgi:hypothetical protein
MEAAAPISPGISTNRKWKIVDGWPREIKEQQYERRPTTRRRMKATSRTRNNRNRSISIQTVAVPDR